MFPSILSLPRALLPVRAKCYQSLAAKSTDLNDLSFKMRSNICFRLHLKQLVKAALLLSVLWITISSIWSHFRRSDESGTFKINFDQQHGSSSSSSSSQNDIDYISTNLRIRYNLLCNDDRTFTAQLTLRNHGNRSIPACCWSMVFYHFSVLDAVNIRRESPDSFKFFHDDSLEKPASSSESGFSIVHVNGNTYQLKATKGFRGFNANDEVKLTLTGQRWIVSRSQILPKWYITADDGTSEPRLLSSTIDLDFVDPFQSDEQVRRSSKDVLRPFTPEKRFEMNAVAKDLRAAPREILPSPLEENFELLPKELHVLSSGWSISFGKGLENEANYLKDHLEIEALEEMKSGDHGNVCSTRTIFIDIVTDLLMSNNANVKSSSQSYKLTIDPNKECITILAISSTGVFHACVSLLSLAKKTTSQGEFYLTQVELIDEPRFNHRGVMIDVARNFRTKEEILRLIDALAIYKMNKLHLHLTDDEGWRLEIPGLEELTEFGGRRGHDPGEKHHLMSMLGSGPFTNSSGSGFYSRSTYQEILRHARSRHVEVIPEFDMPGHSHAAVRSMELRRARLIAEGHETEAEDYVLSDPLDKSEFLSAQFFFDGVMNPCLQSTYRFVNHVVEEVVKMHKEIQPLKRFHFGGDEVPNGAYAESPACKEFLRNHPTVKHPKDLKRHFIREISAIVDHHGVAVEGWEDAFSDAAGNILPRDEMKAKEVVSQAWYNIWERDYAHRAYEYANEGYKVILTPATIVYFDNPQEPDADDWGLHWATRYIDTRRTFFFAPDSFYDNIDFDFFGNRISKDGMCGKKIKCPQLKSPENIIGIEAALWSEVVRTSDEMDSMLWPRLLAVAERGWHKADWETMELDCDDVMHCSKTKAQRDARDVSWTKFANTLGYKELKRLEDLGINYYLPRPGARVVEGRLEVNSLFPGLVIQTSIDDGKTWNDFNDGSSTYKGNVLLATRSFDGKRRSLPVQMKVI